jgi:hypothetical protein
LHFKWGPVATSVVQGPVALGALAGLARKARDLVPMGPERANLMARSLPHNGMLPFSLQRYPPEEGCLQISGTHLNSRDKIKDLNLEFNALRGASYVPTGAFRAGWDLSTLKVYMASISSFHGGVYRVSPGAHTLVV